MKKKEAKCAFRRLLVGACDFTIVSNNCWGGHIYRELGIEYRTPFIGLFIPAPCYLRLLRNFDALIGAPLRFIQESAYPDINQMRRERGLSYPIALLGDEVEINFMHYGSAEEAQDKWRYRSLRMAEDRTRYFFKFDDNCDTRDHIEQFCSLPLANKICFTIKPLDLPKVVQVPVDPQTGRIVDGYILGRISKDYFNTLRWISSRPSYVPLPSLL
jgi:uncharacterized protein (DUF1919 family)